MSPLAASGALWGLWAISWMLAAVWNRRAAARVSLGVRILDLAPTVFGTLLMAYSLRVRVLFGDAAPALWRLPSAADWALACVEALGFGFCWWARLTLGDLWSSSVTRKDGHVVVERGPYGLVRHPIYTGIILAALALAAQLGSLTSLAGAALMAVGFALKARLEERFLSAQLGEAAYADYRSRTPMLIPFWPMSGPQPPR
jgi:protein-S-isoprenylcysteine O-methyltransferase Ste14